MNMNVQSATGVSLAHSPVNDTREHEFNLRVAGYGRAKAAGIDSLPMFALDFIRAVAEGVVETKPDASKEDAAARYFNKYTMAADAKSIHDRSKDSVKAQQSKVRALQKAAANPKWDFIQVADHAIRAIADFKKNEIDTKSTFAALVDVAREQLKSDTELTFDEVAVICLPSTIVREVTLESKLRKINKEIEGLVSGENKDDLQDESPELQQVYELMNERIKQVVAFGIKTADDKLLAEIAARRGGVYTPTEA